VANIIRAENPRRVNVDDIGVGGGVVDRLIEMGFGDIVSGINVGEEASEDEKFANLRAEGWWTVSDWLKTGGICSDKGMVGALTSTNYRFTSTGRIIMEAKEDVKRRLGRSPDEGDALMLALLCPKEKYNVGVLFQNA
jgi:hypothetical protein